MTSTTSTTARRPRPGRYTATALRWVHLLAGILISVYFLFKPAGGWPDGVEVFMAQVLVPFVAWTGIIRWQLPRYRRWRAKRRAGGQPSAATGNA
jgi:hypothetical protein